jgi:uncharacterized protein (DUF1330 family)
MKAYGGQIERVIEVESDSGASTFREIHIVTFPDAAALDAYQRDPQLASLAAIRARAVESTVLVRGRDARFSYSFE